MGGPTGVGRGGGPLGRLVFCTCGRTCRYAVRAYSHMCIPRRRPPPSSSLILTILLPPTAVGTHSSSVPSLLPSLPTNPPYPKNPPWGHRYYPSPTCPFSASCFRPTIPTAAATPPPPPFLLSSPSSRYCCCSWKWSKGPQKRSLMQFVGGCSCPPSHFSFNLKHHSLVGGSRFVSKQGEARGLTWGTGRPFTRARGRAHANKRPTDDGPTRALAFKNSIDSQEEDRRPGVR